MQLAKANQILLDMLPLERRAFLYGIRNASCNIISDIAKQVDGTIRLFSRCITVKDRTITNPNAPSTSERIEKAYILLPALSVLSRSGHSDAYFNGMILFEKGGKYRETIILLNRPIRKLAIL